MRHADVARELRDRKSSTDDLRGRCLLACVSRQLFGTSSRVSIAEAHFTMQRRLGAGAMGVVYEVEREGQTGRLALKLLHRAGRAEGYRLKREFRTLARLGHPNLVALHELFVDAESAAFTMELVRGVDFLAYVRPDGELCTTRLRDVVTQLCEGLAHLHAEGIVHRDLKPSNVLVTAAGRAVLLDFGVALTGPERDVSGTVPYMAPEQRRGGSVPASDMFALGVMLARVLPRAAAEHPELTLFRALSTQLQQPDPAARPSALEVQRQLRGTPRRFLARGAPRFVGRADELAQLTAFGAAARRVPRLVYIEAPSGQGKSSLMAELVCRLSVAAPETMILTGRCCRRETVRYRALDPLIDALSDALCAAGDGLTSALAQATSRHLLALFPVLERVPSFAAGIQHGAPLADPRERRAEALKELRKLLAQLCLQHPVVMCLDDVHWLDDDSFAVMRALFGGAGAPAILWLCAGRPHEADVGARLAQAIERPSDVCQLFLGPLAAADAHALARSLLPERADLWECATALSAGSPFVLSQLDQTALARQPGAALTIAGLLTFRMESLPEAARSLLSVVALAAQPLSPLSLCQAVDLTRADVEGALSLLEAQRYVRPTTTQPICIEPYHDRVAEYVAESLSETQRRDVHRSVASALEGIASPSQARALWFHYGQAGEPEKARHFGALAAAEASAQLRFHDAATLYAACAELTRDERARSAFAEQRAEALVNAGRDADAAEVLRGLVASAETPERKFALACRAATLFLQAGHADAALALLAPFLRALGLRPHTTPVGRLASLLYHRGRVALSRRGRRARVRKPDSKALARVEVCLLLARGLGRIAPLHGFDYASRLAFHVRRGASDQQLARSRLLEALLRANMAPLDPRIDAAISAARTYAEVAADPVLRARVAATAARCANIRFDRAGALHHAEEAVRLFEQHAHGAQMDLGEVRWLYQLMRLTAGVHVVSEMDEVVRDAVQRGDRYTEKNARIYLAVACLARGDVARARREADTVIAACAPGFREGVQVTALTTQARVDLYVGAPTRAYERLQLAERGLRAHGFAFVPSMRFEVRYLSALAALQAGMPFAPRLVRQVARKFSAEPLYWPQLLARQLGAALLAHEGHSGRAVAALMALSAELEQVGAVWVARGSQLFAHELSGNQREQARLITALSERGTPEPRRFLAAYAPFLRLPALSGRGTDAAALPRRRGRHHLVHQALLRL